MCRLAGRRPASPVHPGAGLVMCWRTGSPRHAAAGPVHAQVSLPPFLAIETHWPLSKPPRLLRETFEPEQLTPGSSFGPQAQDAVVEVGGVDVRRAVHDGFSL